MQVADYLGSDIGAIAGALLPHLFPNHPGSGSECHELVWTHLQTLPPAVLQHSDLAVPAQLRFAPPSTAGLILRAAVKPDGGLKSLTLNVQSFNGVIPGAEDISDTQSLVLQSEWIHGTNAPLWLHQLQLPELRPFTQ